MLKSLAFVLALTLATTANAFTAAQQRQVLNPRPPTTPVYSGFTPSSLSTLAAWWDADDLTPGAVTTWTDRKNSIALANVGTPSDSATGWVGTIGGTKAAVTCNGTTDAFVSVLISALPNGTTSGEVAQLAAMATLSASSDAIAYGGTGSGANRQSLYDTTGYLVVSDGGSNTKNRVRIGLGNHVARNSFSTAVYLPTIDGITSNPVVPSAMNTLTTRARLCANTATAAANFFAGTIRHAIVTGVLTTIEEQKLEGYLAWDGYSQTLLAFNHPYRFRRP